MGKKPIKDQVVENFVKKLTKKVKVEKIILFGSRARGDALIESDYDFIIVSKDFEGIHFTERMAWMYDFWESGLALEALCYTPDEFAKKSEQISIVSEAVKEGIEIAA